MGAVNYTSDQFEFLIYSPWTWEGFSYGGKCEDTHARHEHFWKGYQISVTVIISTKQPFKSNDPAYVSPSHEFSSLASLLPKRIKSID